MKDKDPDVVFNTTYVIVCAVAVAVVLLDVFYWRA